VSENSNALTAAIDELTANGATKKSADATFAASQAKVKDALAAVQADADKIASDATAVS
jgi:hypothetical protein